MATVPVYESREKLQPTQWDPRTAAKFGEDVVDLSEGLSGLGQQIQKLDDRRQTLKAETYLAKAHNDNLHFVSTDPDIDTLDERLNNRTDDNISKAADLIKSPEARSNFVSNAQRDVERRNAPLFRTILTRKSQDFKNELVQANDADIQEYQSLADPEERQLMRQKIMDRTTQAIQDGHVHADWAKAHVQSLLKYADINQVKSDMAIDPTHTYEQIQKGSEGLYPYLNANQRKQFADKAQAQIKKEGSDNKLIYGIAQNHAENSIIDKMASNSLTQEDVGNAQLMGIKGIRIRPEFAKAASQAINDPFPTESVPDKYNKLIQQIQDPDMDPMTLKLNILNARGLTPQEKAHLINAHLKEDPEEGKMSVNDMINQGIKQNKQALMQANKKLQAEQQDRASFFRNITGMFRDHAKDDAHLASLQQDYYEKVQNVKNDKDRLQLAKEIMNGDTLKRNPGIASSDPKGTIFMDKSTGAKRKYYPSGFWEPVKSDE